MTKRLEVHQHIKENRDQHLARIREFMAQPSVSVDDMGMRECAELQLKYYQELGCKEAEIVETPGFPGVWAYYDAGAAKTLVVYTYFDTNAVGDGWTNDPYDVVLAERAPFKEVLYGRGAGNKGTSVAFLNALSSIIAVEGTLPVNLMFVTEGEEFVGSLNIPMMIDKYRHHLSKADAGISPGRCQSANGDVTFHLANKGNLHIELECSGDMWGKGPHGGPAHSSAACVVDHPVWRLIQALATMYDPEENRILVEGFYDGLLGPTDEDLELIDDLVERGLVPGGSGAAEIPHYIDGISGRELLIRYCFQPTMNINGLRAGYTGPGTLLWTLPNSARVTIDHRLPPNLEPPEIAKKIRTHLDKHGYSDISMKILMDVTANKLGVNDDIAQAGLRVIRDWADNPAIWPRQGASGPTGVFSKMLGIKVLGGTGMGFGSGHTGGDEFMVTEGDGKVGGLVELEQSLVDLIYSYAAYPNEYK